MFLHAGGCEAHLLGAKRLRARGLETRHGGDQSDQFGMYIDQLARLYEPFLDLLGKDCPRKVQHRLQSRDILLCANRPGELTTKREVPVPFIDDLPHDLSRLAQIEIQE